MQKSSFRIEGLGGEKTLSGTITVAGAKNEVLKTMAAAVLFEDAVHITNVPQIEDVARMTELLEDLGARVDSSTPHELTIDPAGLSSTDLTSDIAKRMRASVVLTGPLLARFGRVSFPHPGGCVIGARPIDIFLDSFRKMGATVAEHDDRYEITTNGTLTGAEIFFKFVSVGATETIMLAATMAEGTTILHNAAMEPEIGHLAEFLNRCGAKVSGTGTPTITIEGNGPLRANGAAHETIPDRIETGSFMLFGALAARDLTIERCDPEHVGIVIALLRDAGVPIEVAERAIHIRGNTKPNDAFRAFNIRTHEYPGFATDIQPLAVVFLTQATGESTVFETIYENRLGYTEDLVKMGANITTMNPQQILIKGPTPLKGRELEGPDLRAGLAFILAATIASRESLVHNAYNIDRGYERIEERLRAVGVDIERVGE